MTASSSTSTALELRDLTEIGEAVPSAALWEGGAVEYDFLRPSRPFSIIVNFRAVQAPIDIAVDQKLARARQKSATSRKVRNEMLALQEPAAGSPGKQLLHSAGDALVAELVAARLHHLAVVVADGQELVEGDHDRHARQRLLQGEDVSTPNPRK